MFLKSLISLLILTPAVFADVNVYTDRDEKIMEPLAASFEKQTGVKVNFIIASGSDIVGRLQAEGQSSPADVAIVKDMFYLNQLAGLGLFQPMIADTSEVPSAMKSPENLWAAVTMRARTIVYNKDKVDPSELQTYASLGESKWKNKLCVRTSQSTYNYGLISGLIADLGFDDAKSIVDSWVKNFYETPLSSDRSVLEAIENGQCDVGLVNSYYLGQENDAENNLNIDIAFANQNSTGTHVNGTGAGVLVFSRNVADANLFMDYVLSAEGQKIFSDVSYEFPVTKDVLSPQSTVNKWLGFKANSTNWTEINSHLDEAYKIIEEVGYE